MSDLKIIKGLELLGCGVWFLGLGIRGFRLGFGEGLCLWIKQLMHILGCNLMRI